MTVKAKEVLKDKFWIVENDGEKIGTMSWNDDRFMLSGTDGTRFFSSERQLRKTLVVH